jgi:hypothetical protein
VFKIIFLGAVFITVTLAVLTAMGSPSLWSLIVAFASAFVACGFVVLISGIGGGGWFDWFDGGDGGGFDGGD